MGGERCGGQYGQSALANGSSRPCNALRIPGSVKGGCLSPFFPTVWRRWPAARVPTAKSRTPTAPSKRDGGTPANSGPRNGPSPTPPSIVGVPVPPASAASISAPPAPRWSAPASSTARTSAPRPAAPRSAATVALEKRSGPDASPAPARPAPRRTVAPASLWSRAATPPGAAAPAALARSPPADVANPVPETSAVGRDHGARGGPGAPSAVAGQRRPYRIA